MRPAMLRLFSITGLVAVSSMYYHQAMLAVLANELAIPPERVGWIPTATWSGYALGILLFVPLGDRLELRRITLAKLACLACALLAAATAPNYHVLIAASVFIGLFTSVVQDIVPYGAHLAAPLGHQHDDPIGLAELVGPQHDSRVAVEVAGHDRAQSTPPKRRCR